MHAGRIGSGLYRDQRPGQGTGPSAADTLAVSRISDTPPARREATEHDTLRIDAIIYVARFDKAYGLGDVVERSLHEAGHIARLYRRQAHLGAHDADARHPHIVQPRNNRFAAPLRG